MPRVSASQVSLGCLFKQCSVYCTDQTLIWDQTVCRRQAATSIFDILLTPNKAQPTHTPRQTYKHS